MASEIEAAAVGGLGGSDGRRTPLPPPGATCANCGAILQGRYCHVCSQDSDHHKRSIWRLIWESAETWFELDGRLMRTIPALFLRPGGLARDYMEGRVVRHVPPFRTFLVALVLFIFAAEHAAQELSAQNKRQQRAEAAVLATPAGRAAAASKRRAEAALDLKEALAEAATDRAEELKDPDDKPEKVASRYDKAVAKAQARYAMRLDKADRIAKGLPVSPTVEVPGRASGWFKQGVQKAIANPDYYRSILFTWGQRAAILLLPIVGLSLALVYRRRREIFIYDHLIVAMNLLSFAFLTNAAGLVLPPWLMGWWFTALAVWTPINMFQTLRGAYGSTILGAILKTLVVWTIAGVAFGALLVGLVLFSLAEI